MKKKPNLMACLLFLTVLLCIGFLLLFSYTTYKQIITTEQDLESVMEPIGRQQQTVSESLAVFTETVEAKQAFIKYQEEKSRTRAQNAQERAPVEEAEAAAPSVFSQVEGEGDGFTSSQGYVVGIDPGHQSEAVDMSAQEPSGPGSSEMKARATSGTQGSYSGVPEYQLNLDVSLVLKDVLEQRGYQVVMTRKDNDTAISNMERAQLAAQQGADIYVRIHANGDDTHTASGALTMSPSANNPYIPQLYDSSNRLSQCIIDSYCAATGFANLGVQYYDNMTGINWSSVPVTIVEMGFMTNEYDDLKMNDAAFRQTMASGIADGIDAYFAQ